MLKNKISIFPVLLFILLNLNWGTSDALAQVDSKGSIGNNVIPAISVRSFTEISVFDRCTKPEYPRAALRSEMTGQTVLDLVADSEGKVIKVDVARSSGWRILDEAVLKVLMGCKIFDGLRMGKVEVKAAYSWSLESDGLPSKAAEVLTATCNKSKFVRLAKDSDPGRGIVIGVWLNKDGGIERTNLEWLIDPKLDQESVRLVTSCKFKPAFDAMGNLASAISLRLLPARLD